MLNRRRRRIPESSTLVLHPTLTPEWTPTLKRRFEYTNNRFQSRNTNILTPGVVTLRQTSRTRVLGGVSVKCSVVDRRCSDRPFRERYQTISPPQSMVHWISALTVGSCKRFVVLDQVPHCGIVTTV